jgi:Trp operon repressor
VKEEYLTELDRITFLFQYLSTLLDGTDSKEEREELAASVARITRCREILELWLEPIKQALA